MQREITEKSKREMRQTHLGRHAHWNEQKMRNKIETERDREKERERERERKRSGVR